MKKIKLIENNIEIIKSFDYIKDNGNNSNYIGYHELTEYQKELIEKICNKEKKPFKIKINNKYVGKYGKCGAWHYVFNFDKKYGNVLIHEWSGNSEEINIKKLNERWIKK